jgi:hypothetical protein
MASKASIRKKLIWEAYAAIEPGLTKLGFKKVRPGFHRCALGQEVSGWLVLGQVSGTHESSMGIFPQIALLFDQIERLRASIDNREQDPDQLTFGYPLYLVMANPKKDNTWELGLTADNRVVVLDLLVAIETYAVPFLNKFTDLASLRRYVDEGHSFPNMSYVLPMTHYAMGNVANARRSLAEFLNAAQQSPSPIYGKTYSGFADRFAQLMNGRITTG